MFYFLLEERISGHYCGSTFFRFEELLLKHILGFDLIYFFIFT